MSWWKKRVDYSRHRTTTWVANPILVRTRVSRLDEALLRNSSSNPPELMSGIEDSGDDNDGEWVASS